MKTTHHTSENTTRWYISFDGSGAPKPRRFVGSGCSVFLANDIDDSLPLSSSNPFRTDAYPFEEGIDVESPFGMGLVKVNVFEEGGSTFTVDFGSLAETDASVLVDIELSCSLPRRDFIAVSIGAVLRPLASLGGFKGGVAIGMGLGEGSAFGTDGKVEEPFGGGGGGLGGLFVGASGALISKVLQEKI